MNYKHSRFPVFVLSFFITILSCSGQVYSDERIPKDILRIHFIDVGYGDAVFFELPGDGTMMVDAGEKQYATRMINYLRSLNVRAIDTAIITHPHTNHFEGFFDILERVPVRRVYINGDQNAQEGYDGLLAAFRQKSIPVETLRRADTLPHMPDTVRVEVLHPAELLGSPNNNSIVFRLKHHDISVVFMGDVEIQGQQELISVYGDIGQSDAVKVPHHGGALSDEFVRTFHNKVFVISTGPNKWGWPQKEDVGKLKGTVYRTDLDGTVVLESDGHCVSVKTLGSKKE